jgi:glyoxylase-like metal-dependent hydrolase (beta-lactamase superfamily II)
MFIMADISAFFHQPTHSVTYLVTDTQSGKTAIIDPVLDFEQSGGLITTRSADQLIETIGARKLSVEWILETHIHADHLSAAHYLKSRIGGKVCIGANIRQAQDHWAKVFHITDEFGVGAKHFDLLFEDGDFHKIGSQAFRVMFTPGHTQADVTYVIGDAAFVGDTLFMPDYGTPRTDFPGGNAGNLYRSIRRILDLPPSTRIFSGHDYLTAERCSHAWESTVLDQRSSNIHIRDGITENAFVAMRTARDAELALPDLIFPAVQMNIRAGRLPPAETNGVVYLKIPITAQACGSIS